MNLLMGFGILAVLFTCIAATYCDVLEACDEAEHELVLDELWTDDTDLAESA